MFAIGFKKVSAFASGIVAAEARAAGKTKKLFGGAKDFKGVTDAGKTNAYTTAAAMPNKAGTRTIKKLDANAAEKSAPKKEAPAAPAAEKEKPSGFGEHFDKAKSWMKKNPGQAVAAAGATGLAVGSLSKNDDNGR